MHFSIRVGNRVLSQGAHQHPHLRWYQTTMKSPTGHACKTVMSASTCQPVNVNQPGVWYSLRCIRKSNTVHAHLYLFTVKKNKTKQTTKNHIPNWGNPDCETSLSNQEEEDEEEEEEEEDDTKKTRGRRKGRNVTSELFTDVLWLTHVLFFFW
jgi:hypothetical protein